MHRPTLLSLSLVSLTLHILILFSVGLANVTAVQQPGQGANTLMVGLVTQGETKPSPNPTVQASVALTERFPKEPKLTMPADNASSLSASRNIANQNSESIPKRKQSPKKQDVQTIKRERKINLIEPFVLKPSATRVVDLTEESATGGVSAVEQTATSGITKPLQDSYKDPATQVNAVGESHKTPKSLSGGSVGSNAPGASSRGAHSDGSTNNGEAYDTYVNPYRMEIFRRIEQKKRYPLLARMQQLNGVVVVGFTIHKNGETTNITLLRASEKHILDQDALETIHRASPFPPLPKELGVDRLPVTLSIAYDLEDP